MLTINHVYFQSKKFLVGCKKISIHYVEIRVSLFSMRTDIEFFRIIAAFGVVWFHSELELWRSVAYGGLIYFVILSPYFSMVSSRQYTFFNRVQRIIIPYLFWFSFYFIFLFLAGKSINPKDYSLLSFLMSSPSIHLWFLPFVFIVLCLTDVAKKFMDKKYNYIFCLFSALSAVILIVTSPIWRTYSLPVPFAQYAHVTAAVCIGVFFSFSYDVSKYLILILIGILVGSMLWMVHLGHSAMGISYLVGFIPCTLLLAKKSFFGKNSFILFFASMSFGVYLVHMFWLMVLRHFDIAGALLPIASFLLSILCVWVIKRYLPENFRKYII